MPTTYNDLYLDIRRELKRAGIGAASLEARELVCFGSGKTREGLVQDGRLYVSAEVEGRIRELVDRHLSGEPVAYLIGEWEFYGLTLDVSEEVLIPRSDTETLAEEAIGHLRGQGSCRVLDLCAGSGCVGLAIAAHVPEARVLLGELSEKAVRICRQNIRRCQLTGQVSVMVMDALQKPLAAIGEFDAIVCNPPYIPDSEIAYLDPSVRDFEPHQALKGGADGLDFYRSVASEWRAVLKTGGQLFFEVGIGQADAVLRPMRTSGFGDINVTADSRGVARVVYGTLIETI